VVDGKVTDEIEYLSAINEAEHVIAQANAPNSMTASASSMTSLSCGT
jgi:DNA-directed RNA polymerase beta subunit